MSIRCLIVDDEPLARDLLEGYVKKTPFLQLAGKCRSAVEALEVIEEREVDLLFLDIQMPELTGLELSQALGKKIKVIFTTAFGEYALAGFKVNALDYLLKPFNYTDFLKAAHKAKEWFGLINNQAPDKVSEKESLLVKSDYKLIRIDLDDILFFEGMKDYVKIYQENQARPVLSLMTLKSLEEQLPAQRFMPIHRSFIINLSKVNAVERSHVQIGKEAIPIAEKYKEKFQQYLSNHFLQ
jgi:DNA-binding LytR/AlgR family response regulator